eukprot:403356032
MKKVQKQIVVKPPGSSPYFTSKIPNILGEIQEEEYSLNASQQSSEEDQSSSRRGSLPRQVRKHKAPPQNFNQDENPFYSQTLNPSDLLSAINSLKQEGSPVKSFMKQNSMIKEIKKLHFNDSKLMNRRASFSQQILSNVKGALTKSIQQENKAGQSGQNNTQFRQSMKFAEPESPALVDSDAIYKMLAKDSRILSTLGLKRKYQGGKTQKNQKELLKIYEVYSDEELKNEKAMMIQEEKKRGYDVNDIIRSALGSQYNSDDDQSDKFKSPTVEDDKNTKLTKFDSIVNSIKSMQMSKQRKTEANAIMINQERFIEDQDSSFQSEKFSSTSNSSDSNFEAPESVFMNLQNRFGLGKKQVPKKNYQNFNNNKQSSKISMAVQNHTFAQRKKFRHLKFDIESSRSNSSQERTSSKARNQKIVLSSNTSSPRSSNYMKKPFNQQNHCQDEMLNEFDFDKELLGDNANQNQFQSPNHQPSLANEFFQMGNSTIAKVFNSSDTTLQQDLESFVMRNRSQQFDVHNTRNSLLKILQQSQNSTGKDKNKNEYVVQQDRQRFNHGVFEQFEAVKFRNRFSLGNGKLYTRLKQQLSHDRLFKRFSSGVISSIHSRGSFNVVQQAQKKQARKVAEFLKKKKKHRLIKKDMIKQINKQAVLIQRDDAFKAVQTNNFLGVENYVKQNLLDLNISDTKENSLLSIAIQGGYYEIADLLIKNGVSNQHLKQ